MKSSKPNQQQLLKSILFLDLNSLPPETDLDRTATLFIQEILYLCKSSIHAKNIIVERFEMEGRKIAFVTKLCYSSFEDALKVVPKTEDSVKKFVSDIKETLHFLQNEMRLEKIVPKQPNLYYCQQSKEFWVGNWIDFEPSNHLRESTYIVNETVSRIDIEELILPALQIYDNLEKVKAIVKSINKEKSLLQREESKQSDTKSPDSGSLVSKSSKSSVLEESEKSKKYNDL